MRRDTMPWSWSIPAAIGLTPWKSKRSHPSSPSSPSVRWSAGSESAVSMSFPVDGPPFGAPFTDALPTARTTHVLHRACAADQQSQQLPQARLVVRAAGGAGRRVECHGLIDGEHQVVADALDATIEVARGDAPGVPQGERARQQRRKQEDGAAHRPRQGQVRLLREVASRRAKDRLRIGPSADEPREGDGLIVCGTLLAADRLDVPLDLGVDGVAQAQSLVAKLGDEFSLQVALRGIDVSDSLEQA